MARLNRIMSVLICIGFLAGLFGIFGCATSQKHESTGEYLDDSVITTKVKSEILGESSLKTLQISVETYKGVVQLSGFVDSAQSVTKAAEVAARVKGVVSVKNDLIVK